MSDKTLGQLSRELVRGSIVEGATARFIELVLKEVHDSRIKPLHDRIEELEAKLAKAVEAMQTLQADMLERAELHIDTIRGEQYRVVNAGNGAWTKFCTTLAELKGENT